MRRGRILQTLTAAANSRAEEAHKTEQALEEAQQEAAATPTASPPKPPEAPRTVARGRGGFITRQLASIRSTGGDQPVTTQEQVPPPPAQTAPQTTPPAVTHSTRDPRSSLRSESRSSESTHSGQLARQSSDLSRSSVISQQFAIVESQNLRAGLLKTPSQNGVPVTLGTNYMTFETKDGVCVQQYHADFNPDIESIRLRYHLLRSEEAQRQIGTIIYWTGTNLYLPSKLAQDVTIFQGTHPVTNTPVKVRLTFVKTPPDDELLPFYNSLMHKVMNRLDYVIINRQHYSPLHRIAIEQHKLEVWPGWLTSIQRLDGGMKLSIDATFRVLRLETVRDIMQEIKQRCRGPNLKAAFESELVGSIVMTRYNNRSYRIDEIDITKKPTDTFTMKNGTQVSYVDYLRQHWNVEVRDLMQPMICHRPKPKRGQEPEIHYLVPELCVTTGLTEDMRSNFTIMKAIGDHTRLPPQVREAKLREFLRQLSTDERARTVLEDWGLSVRSELDVVPGRRLDTETVLFGNQRSYKVGDDVDWGRQATNGPVFQSVPIDNWVVMCPETSWSFAQDFLNCLQDVVKSLDIRVAAPRIVKLQGDSPMVYVNAGKQNVRRTDQMVVLLTPGKYQREDRYSACKRLYSCDMPVPCQFIRCGTVGNLRKIRSITQKIAIQMLAKVGGQPWAMKFPMKKFMIIGIDTYHDTIDRKKSCVGFVASMNEFTSSWWSQTFFQSSLEEIGQKLNSCMANALRRFHTINGHVPLRIIVYRDGVGDGQLETVLEIEIAQFVNGIKYYMRDSHAGEEIPSISYIVVQKRINAKLSLHQGSTALNPCPGSYLDHTITHPEYNDFYLVSQHVNQGTVSPTKYILLTETGTLKLEHHQKLAYKMTHMYYNWCGTIRVPAPCQYAHKLAYLTGQNIRQQASERIEDKLYYL